MEQLVIVDLKGKLDAETGKQVEADHADALQGKNANNRCVICGHIDEDAKGCSEWDESPYYPNWCCSRESNNNRSCGAYAILAHMGHPCGQDFIGEKFYKAHSEYAWQAKYLNNMLAYPWTLFSAKTYSTEKR